MMVARQDIKKRSSASLFSLGSMIAWLYSRVIPAAITPTTALKDPKIPKSDGVNKRLIIGITEKPTNCAMAVPDITTKTFLAKDDRLSLAEKLINRKFKNLIAITLVWGTTNPFTWDFMPY
jgi:hypothetical protein